MSCFPTPLDSSYQVLAVLGSGSFGQALLARTRLPENKVCVLKRMVRSKKQLQNQRREVAIMKSVSHPFLGTHQTGFQNNRAIYLQLDFHSGGSLARLMEDWILLVEADAKFYLTELTEALLYLHHTGVLHADLKPDNVMLSARGHIKVIDFGLSLDEMKPNSRISGFRGTRDLSLIHI